MYTSFDKALVTLVMAVIGIVGVLWKPLNVSPEVVATVVSAITPVLVYLMPNVPKDTTT